MSRNDKPATLRLFICDNGRTLCSDCLGCSAKTTGRDISGQSIMPVPADMAKAHGLQCESCR